jgi:cell division protein FtsX
MDRRIGTPFKISLTAFGPTVFYSGSYEITANKNVISGNVHVTLSGPATKIDLQGQELDVYEGIWKRMRLSGIRYLGREASGTLFADWGGDNPPTIGQSVKINDDGKSFSAVWSAIDVEFDDGPDMVAAVAAVAKELDPASAAAMIEEAVKDVDALLRELFVLIS